MTLIRSTCTIMLGELVIQLKHIANVDWTLFKFYSDIISTFLVIGVDIILGNLKSLV